MGDVMDLKINCLSDKDRAVRTPDETGIRPSRERLIQGGQLEALMEIIIRQNESYIYIPRRPRGERGTYEIRVATEDPIHHRTELVQQEPERHPDTDRFWGRGILMRFCRHTDSSMRS
jgi:hypothetical protein